MVEFSVFHIKEGSIKLFSPKSHSFNHYHNYKKKIIYQPQLADILFFEPNTNNYTSLFCRTIWNKLTRKTLLINSIKYVEKSFHDLYLITADDTPINILNFHLANNYSNIKLPGYLYNLRKKSESKFNDNKKHNILISYNYLLYFKFLYKYLKDNNKNINFMFCELKKFYRYMFIFKNLKVQKYISISII
jgi:hypothetical protein